MTKRELKQLMAFELSTKLKQYGCEVNFASTVKSNDMTVESIVISGHGRVAQSIDVEWLYQEYCCGTEIDEIVTKIVQKVVGGIPSEVEEIANVMTDFELIKNRIFASVVNTDMNMIWLHDKPHYDIEDLSIVYHVVFNDEHHGGLMRVAITDTIFEAWGIEAEALHRTAINNTYDCNQAVVMPMTQKLMELTNGELDLNGSDCDCNLMVISNKLWLYGAIHMFNADILRDAAKLLGETQLSIIPSSVHEVMVCSTNSMSIEKANQMVREVNPTIDQREVLSNHIYLYDAEENVVRAV